MSKKPFQTGILVTIESIIALHRELKSEGFPYLMTARANQDALESTFSSLRYMGGNCSHPTAANCCDRICLLCLSKSEKFVVENP